MAGEPALDKVLSALKTRLEDALTGVLVEADRPDDSPFGNAEMPALNIRYRGTRKTMMTNCEVLNEASFDLDMIVAVEAAASNAARLREMEASIGEALWADRTLGGLLQDYELQSSAGDEDVLADDGVRPLDFTARYLTQIGDDRTIYGAAGAIA